MHLDPAAQGCPGHRRCDDNDTIPNPHTSSCLLLYKEVSFLLLFGKRQKEDSLARPGE